MSARTTPRRLARTLLASAALVAGVLAVTPAAHADEATDAPVTAADTISLRADNPKVVNVLANDTDPNGDELAICRVEVPDDVPLAAAFVDADLLVMAARNQTGTYEITYWACDHDYLTPATVTVHVTKVKPPKPATPIKATKVAGHAGRVKFTNPGGKPVVVLFGSRKEDKADGQVALKPHTSKTISTERTNLFYVAYVRSTGALAGHGTVRGIKQGHHSAHRAATVPLSQRAQQRWLLAV